MPDLGDVMWESVRERARGLDDLALAADDLSTVRRRVRRGRTARHVREAAIAAPVVAAVAAAGWFGVDRLTDVEPPVTSPAPTTTPAPDWTRDPALEGLELGDPIDDPTLPTHYALPEGLLDRVGPGWVLAMYQEIGDGGVGVAPAWPPMPTIVVGDHVVLLVSPGGTRFHVARLPVDDAYLSRVISWDLDAGRVRVHVVSSRAQDPTEVAWLDLATGDLEAAGALTADDLAALNRTDHVYSYPEVRIERPDGGGYVSSGRFRVRSYYAYVDADGARPAIPYGVGGRECTPVGWSDDGTFLALCMRDDYALGLDERGFDPELYAVTAATGAAELVRAIGPDDPLPRPGSGAWVRDGVVAFVSSTGGYVPDCGMTGVHLWDGAGFSTVAQPSGSAEDTFWIRTLGDTVYVEARAMCSGDWRSGDWWRGTSVTSYDAAGRAVVLIPEQDDAEDLHLDGWIVAGE